DVEKEADRISQADVLRLAGLHRRRPAPSRRRIGRGTDRPRHRLPVSVDVDGGRSRPDCTNVDRRGQDRDSRRQPDQTASHRSPLMTRPIIGVLVLAAAVVGADIGAAQSPASKNEYSDGKTWLCKTGRQDACALDLTTTILAADGKLNREEWKANRGAPIDCFYVYPTVSMDPGGNSDMTAGPEENGVVRAQFARFASQCRVYAPLYRQATLTALRAATTGSP